MRSVWNNQRRINNNAQIVLHLFYAQIHNICANAMRIMFHFNIIFIALRCRSDVHKSTYYQLRIHTVGKILWTDGILVSCLGPVPCPFAVHQETTYAEVARCAPDGSPARAGRPTWNRDRLTKSFDKIVWFHSTMHPFNDIKRSNGLKWSDRLKNQRNRLISFDFCHQTPSDR